MNGIIYSGSYTCEGHTVHFRIKSLIVQRQMVELDLKKKVKNISERENISYS